MKRIKGYLFKAAAVWALLISLQIIFGKLSWNDLSVELVVSKLRDLEALAVFFLLTAALLVFCSLRYWITWILVLFGLMLSGSGIDLPQNFVLFPEKLSIVPVFLTLVAVSVFWILEKLAFMYIGSDPSSGVENSFIEEEEIITLSLNVESPNGR